MVTLKEIAKVCGISATAVSKALRNESDISKETIEKVQKVADELGYSPNIAAVRLKTNLSYMLGILLKDDTDSGVEHEFFATIVNPFIKRAKNYGYSVMFVTDRVGKRKVTPTEFANAYGCDGVLILAGDFKDKEIVELVNSDIPVVTVDYVFNDCSAIISDNDKGICEMLKYAHEMGHRKIAYVHGEDTVVSRIRRVSFLKTCNELGINVPEEYIVEGHFHDVKSTEKITHKFLDLPDPPTFIFYQDDFSFIGGRNAIAQRGMVIPDDISVAAYDGFVLSQVIKPKLMTWKQNTTEIGKKSADILIDAIENPKTYLPRIVEVQGELLRGQSVKKID